MWAEMGATLSVKEETGFQKGREAIQAVGTAAVKALRQK